MKVVELHRLPVSIVHVPVQPHDAAEWRSIMITILFDAADNTILDMDYLICLIALYLVLRIFFLHTHRYFLILL